MVQLWYRWFGPSQSVSFKKDQSDSALPRSPGFGQTCSTDIPTDRQTVLTDRVQLASHGSSKQNRCARDFDLGEYQMGLSLCFLVSLIALLTVTVSGLPCSKLCSLKDAGWTYYEEEEEEEERLAFRCQQPNGDVRLQTLNAHHYLNDGFLRE
ncbi:hypothetical protein PAMA_009739 [Pampus argenteus]